MEYIGEHPLAGQIGHIAVILSFTASLVAALAYFFATQKRETVEELSWKKIGRGAFSLHALSVFTLIGCLFYVMLNKHYEYQYVQQHVNDELDNRYIFSAFWEGQEGSFLLWMFWHIILGFVILFRKNKWEAPTLSVLSLVQLFIGSMILGIYIKMGGHEYKIGSNPTLLLRDVVDAPIFSQADYVSKITGNGLNPLLQNYWMTIHPPTLFLGFASTLIPFCFAIAGLWLRLHKEWMRPALSWALFSAAILGTGILMGGAWAYEALSFGGYWAWDPVENMSLVPWLVLIAGIHTNLIAQSTGNAIRSTYIYYLLTFILIIYSTFLTRSGILGETSVHAFTELGLEWQLVAFMAVFVGIGAWFYASRYKEIPSIEKEESATSKEFWMFIGSLVLLFSAFLITFSTSIPVYNKISEALGKPLNMAPPAEPVAHYNKYQLWIGVFIGLLSGIAQLLRYKEINWQGYAKKFMSNLGISVLISIVLTFLTTQWISISAWQYWILLFTGIFAIVSNLDYFIAFTKMNAKMVGSILAHVGFGVMIVGVIASGLNKEIISKNEFLLKDVLENNEELRKNVMLIKGQPMLMNNYEVTYVNDTMWNHSRKFLVNYKKKNKEGKVTEEFNLEPNILYSKEFDKVAATNPATKRYLDKDIFTHISSLPVEEMDLSAARTKEDTLKYQLYEANIGDTIYTKNYYAVIESYTKTPKHKEYKPLANDIAIGAKVLIRKIGEDKSWTAEPVVVARENQLLSYPFQVHDLAMRVRLPEQVFSVLLKDVNNLPYTTFNFKEGETINYNGYKIQLKGFNPTPIHSAYKKEEGDIAIGAILDVSKGNQHFEAQPIFFIRNQQPFVIKDAIESQGLYFEVAKVDPATKIFSINIAQLDKNNNKIPVEIAENSLRSDYIVLQAILFPGINLFWLGSCLMMLGFAVSMWKRMRNQ